MLGHHWPAPVSETPMIARALIATGIVFPLIKNVRVWQNFLDLRMVAYIDDAHVGPRIVHEN